MTDYIKKDDAIAVINNYIGDDSPYAQWLVRKIEQIDVVPVVRCKDCRWWTKQEKSIQGRCALNGTYPTGGWYCANGRRDDE